MKGLLDVADNLERAIGSASEEAGRCLPAALPLHDTLQSRGQLPQNLLLVLWKLQCAHASRGVIAFFCSKMSEGASEEQAAQRLQSLLQGIAMTQRQLERVPHAIPPIAHCLWHAQAWLAPGLQQGLRAWCAVAQAFESNGVTKVEPKVGDTLDPNLHEALFDIPNPNQEPGTIGVVTKVLPLTPTCSMLCLCNAVLLLLDY